MFIFSRFSSKIFSVEQCHKCLHMVCTGDICWWTIQYKGRINSGSKAPLPNNSKSKKGEICGDYKPDIGTVPIQSKSSPIYWRQRNNSFFRVVQDNTATQIQLSVETDMTLVV